MEEDLDLPDIQGNVIRGYGKFGFPKARYFFVQIARNKGKEGREFVEEVRHKVTTAERWEKSPEGAGNPSNPMPHVTLNIGFSWYGLYALELPTRTLRAMPAEYIDGMAKRSFILGDEGPSDPKNWDKVWGADPTDPTRGAHIWISMNGRPNGSADTFEALEAQTKWLCDLIEESDGVSLLEGHGPDGAKYQEASVLYAKDPEHGIVPLSKEHFGFDDGIGDPVFDRQFTLATEEKRVVGRGKLTPDQEWATIATGEFLLGHVDESQEIPPSAPPIEFTRNGTFMVYRKLHENVRSFHDYIDEKAKVFAKVMDVPVEEAKETLRAKMVGRWSDGVPLMQAPTYAEWKKFNEEWDDIPAIKLKKLKKEALSKGEQRRFNDYQRLLIDFKYGDDLEGTRCPVSAHIRRANTRDMLDPRIALPTKDELSGSSLNKRRRILRRGLPYGTYDPETGSDDGEHGIIFMAVCASLFRQFEFVQQQWINYGLDFNVGNDTCPVIGKHEENAKFVIASDPKSGKPPFVCDQLPQFVTTRGGEYYFIPSITALRMIATGIVDPT